jgi:hypothetical protein
MTTSAASRRAFLAGSAGAVGGFAIGGRLLAGKADGRPDWSIRDMRPGHSGAAAGETMGLYILDLPRPPGDAGPAGFDLAKP